MMTRSNIRMTVRQQPLRAQVVQENNPKNRKPIDPPPIVEVEYENDRDDKTNGQWLVSPRTFMMVTLIDVKESEDPILARNLIGQTVSSLHRLKDTSNKDGGFFVFGDISARKMGSFKLRFSLFDSSKEPEEVVYMGHIDSEPFQVMAQRDFGSMSESTGLTRTFSDQGVKLRVRKDNRGMSGLGTKRPYNASPAASSSPVHPSLYGGAVQDHHYGTTTPEGKRQRSDSEYGHAPLYNGLGETSLSAYNSTIPSSTRQWTTDDHNGRGHINYSQHSPLAMPVMNRISSMNLSSNTSWPSVHQQSALPSPSPSASTHTSSYPGGSSTQTTTSAGYGDATSTSAIPRNYYSDYAYSTLPQYNISPSTDAHPAYTDLQLSGTSLPDATGTLSSTHAHAYTHHYLQPGSIFSADAHDSSGNYPFAGDSQHHKY